MNRAFTCCWIFLVLLLLAACETWEQDMAAGETSPVEPPDWITENPSQDDQEAVFLLESGSIPVTRTPFQPVAPTALVMPTATSTPTLVPTLPPEPEHASNPFPPAKGFPTPAPYLSAQVGGQVFNILLIGSDQRGKGAFRTDTILIASIRPLENSLSILSIPRDLYVYIPAKGMHKINTAYLWGEVNRYPGRGPASLKDTLLYNLGIKIDRYALVNFQGFRKTVDLLGGIDIPLACPFTDWHVINPNRSLELQSNWKLLTVGPGVVHMDGDLALWYARSRLKSSDYDRGRRQQEVIRSIYSQAMRLNVLPRVPEFYQQLRENVKTDLELEDILALMPMALNLNEADIRSYYITAGMVKPSFADGMYVQYPKTERILELVERFLSPPAPEDAIRAASQVEICNLSGNPGWDALAAERLHYAGYETTDCKLGPSEQQSITFVQKLHAGVDSNLSAEILAVLGLPLERLSEALDASTPAYRLVIGKDYDPCFNPLKLTH
jgi:polyisoprenyl-teichoic acid--peptidoglycan teichoic acid transferase